MAARRPDDWLALVATCVTTALAARPGGWTGRVVRSFDGGGETQPCCPDGLLRVEWTNTDRGNVVGSSRCRNRAYVEIHVIIRRCVSAFDIGAGGATDGGAPTVAVVEAESAKIIDDAWTIWQALECCAMSAWVDDNVELLDQAFVNIGTCKGSDTRLRLPLAVCC